MEEFFHTFNALHNANKQVVITSDLPPKQLNGFEDRLRSRFEWGLITDVQPPDLETRIAILRKKASSERLAAPDDVLSYIGSRISTNIRELEGALIRVTAFANLNRQQVDLPLAEIVLKDLITDEDSAEITPAAIIAQTAAYFGLTIDDLCGSSRSRVLVTARQIAMYLCRELTDLSLPKIGQQFGGRDHDGHACEPQDHRADGGATLHVQPGHGAHEPDQAAAPRLRRRRRGPDGAAPDDFAAPHGGRLCRPAPAVARRPPATTPERPGPAIAHALRRPRRPPRPRSPTIPDDPRRSGTREATDRPSTASGRLASATSSHPTSAVPGRARARPRRRAAVGLPRAFERSSERRRRAGCPVLAPPAHCPRFPTAVLSAVDIALSERPPPRIIAANRTRTQHVGGVVHSHPQGSCGYSHPQNAGAGGRPQRPTWRDKSRQDHGFPPKPVDGPARTHPVDGITTPGLCTVLWTAVDEGALRVDGAPSIGGRRVGTDRPPTGAATFPHWTHRFVPRISAR